MSMAGYTKLFNSILASTIWRADMPTRIVWITLLAMADKNGIAEGSVPGLADFARVTLPECQKALDCLMAPDKWSRSQEHDGRRIVAVDGGWQILNHAKYRAKLGADERREYLRIKQAEQRRKRSVNSAVDKSTRSTHTEAEASPQSDPKALKEDRASRFIAFWDRYPRKVGRKTAERAFMVLAPSAELFDTLMTALERQRRQPSWNRDKGQFIPHPAKWLRGERWTDAVASSVPERPPVGDWRDECERLHAGACGNAHFHAAKVNA